MCSIGSIEASILTCFKLAAVFSTCVCWGEGGGGWIWSHTHPHPDTEWSGHRIRPILLCSVSVSLCLSGSQLSPQYICKCPYNSRWRNRYCTKFSRTILQYLRINYNGAWIEHFANHSGCQLTWLKELLMLKVAMKLTSLITRSFGKFILLYSFSFCLK